MLKKLFTICVLTSAMVAHSRDYRGGLSSPNNLLLSQPGKHEISVAMSDLVGIVPSVKLDKQPGLFRFWSETRGKERKVFMVYFMARTVAMGNSISATVSGLKKPIAFREQYAVDGTGAFIAELSEPEIKAFSSGSSTVFLSGTGVSVNFSVEGSLIGQVLK